MRKRAFYSNTLVVYFALMLRVLSRYGDRVLPPVRWTMGHPTRGRDIGTSQARIEFSRHQQQDRKPSRTPGQFQHGEGAVASN